MRQSLDHSENYKDYRSQEPGSKAKYYQKPGSETTLYIVLYYFTGKKPEAGLGGLEGSRS